MKRVALAIVSTVTGLVLLLSFKTHALGTTTVRPLSSQSTPAASPTQDSGSTQNSGTTKRRAASAKRAPKSASASQPQTVRKATVTGNVVETVYGPIQVKVTVTNGKVTSATAVEYPYQDPRDAQINAYAIPILNSEAVQASSADIAHVSGATYTSNGYVASLQSALNKAGL